MNAFASGNGPDIWLMHNTWLPKHSDKIQPLPQLVAGEKTPMFTIKDFQEQFVDQTALDLTSKGEIYGLPLYVDTLALYYNKQLLNSVGIATPPKTWEEFNVDVIKLTQIDSRGNISRAGAAMGTSRNINRSTDILALLMLQSGVNMTNTDNTSATFASSINNQYIGETSLQYFTDFANPAKTVYTWNDQQHYSVDAFVEGNVAMMFNYSHQAETLRAKAPRLDFSIAPMPQLSAANVAVNYENYWAPTVWKQSKNAVEAWRFLTYLTSLEGAAKYIATSGRPPARRDLISQQVDKIELGVFAKQALSARGWYQVDNIEVEKIFAEMIDDVNLGRASIKDAIRSAQEKVNGLFRMRNAYN